MRHIVAVAAVALAVSACTGCSSLSRTVVTPASSAVTDVSAEAACADVPDLDRDLVVANYNIKSGIWTSLDKVQGVIAEMNADVIALEEVDRNMKRSGNVDQAAVVAEALDADHVFAGAWDKDGGSFGIALVSRFPIVKAERIDLPRSGGFEPRVAIDATVCAGKTPVRVVATHVDFLPWAAAAQAKHIATHVADDEGVIVLGDFNATPGGDGIGAIMKKSRKDALAAYDEGPTFPGLKSRLDYILTGRTLKGAKRIVNDASDHFPVMATIELLKPTLQLAATEPTTETTTTTLAEVPSPEPTTKTN